MEKRIRVNVLGVLVACLVIAGAADAAITYEISGTVTMTNAWSLGTSVPSLFTVGDILTGQLTFEPRTVGVVVGSPALAWVFTDAFSDVSLTFPATSTAMP